ncbi:MAG TPA: RDD family protein [Thermoanaerobaculia bacterium]|jgi:uncharacterized RDD family membrane protein YckC
MTTESTLVLPAQEIPTWVRPPFWRRDIAFGIDGFVLGAIVGLLALVAPTAARALGPWGRWAGGAIGVLYFGFAGSARFQGRSIGKRVCGIAVVRRDGTYLPLGASMLRAVVLMLPLTCETDMFLTGRITAVLQGVIVFGIGGVSLYLFIANRATRQTLHDLAVGSLVLRREQIPAAAAAPRVWRGHAAIAAVLLALVLGGPFLLVHAMLGGRNFAAMIAIGEEARAKTGFDVGVQEQMIRLPNRPTRRSLSMTMMTWTPAKNPEALAHTLAAIAARHYDLGRIENADVVIVSGFDLLFAQSVSAKSYPFSHGELLQMARSRQ